MTITLTSDICDGYYELWIQLRTLYTCHPKNLQVQKVLTGLVEYDTSKFMNELSGVQKQNDLAILESWVQQQHNI